MTEPETVGGGREGGLFLPGGLLSNGDHLRLSLEVKKRAHSEGKIGTCRCDVRELFCLVRKMKIGGGRSC